MNEGTGLEEQRARRREAHRVQTYALFLKELQREGDVSKERAEKALVSVLCALKYRLLKGEAEDLEAQLPMKLREALRVCEVQRERPLWKYDRDEFIQMVAEDLHTDEDEAERITRAVFSTVRAHISPGEASQVAQELPAGLKALWVHPA